MFVGLKKKLIKVCNSKNKRDRPPQESGATVLPGKPVSHAHGFVVLSCCIIWMQMKGDYPSTLRLPTHAPHVTDS